MLKELRDPFLGNQRTHYVQIHTHIRLHIITQRHKEKLAKNRKWEIIVIECVIFQMYYCIDEFFHFKLVFGKATRSIISILTK